MKYFLRSLLAILLFPMLCLAQSNYRTGYVVTLKGDTLSGLIDYREWANSPKQISFKQYVNSVNTAHYTTADISLFVVEELVYYKRAVVATGNITADTVFLKAANTKGNVVLYTYNSGAKKRFFVSEINKEPVELQGDYKNRLLKLASVYQPGNSGLASQIQNAAYSEQGLLKIISKINAPKNTEDISNSIRVFAGLGLTNTIIKFDGNNVLPDAQSSSTFPQLNAGADFYLDKRHRFIIRAELNYTGNKVDYTFNAQGNPDYSQTLQYKQYIATFNPQFIYNVYNGTHIKVYIASGVAVNFNNIKDKKSTITYKFTTGASEPTNLPFPDQEAIFATFNAKAGLVLNNRFEIYFAYYPPVQTVYYTEYTMRLLSWHAGINYWFGK